MNDKSICKANVFNSVTFIRWLVSIMMLLTLASPALSLAETVAVYRFYSPVKSRHFYTISESEKTKIINIYAQVWTYEGIAYYAFETDSEPGLVPLYRFWSDALEAHFYTISESEKQKVIDNYSDVWTYEGIAFYVYPEGQQPQDAEPVYRFWSDPLGIHFYTMDETEKNKIIDNYSAVWTYEGVAWYAFSTPPSPFPSTVVEIYDLPATSDTGTYTLKWRVIQGLGSNVSNIQEDSDISFPNPTSYWTYSGERSYLFTDKPDGTYYYRVSVGGSDFSDPASIIVSRATLQLSYISISGPTQVNESSGAQYTCTAHYSDGTTQNVTNSANWSENSSYATISSSGYLTTSAVTSDRSFTITATYGGKTDTHTVTIKDVPTSATLRIINNTHYWMIDIKLNGSQQVYYPNAIAAGGQHDFVFTGAGTVDYELGVGFYDDFGYRDVWFILTGQTTIYTGQTTTITFNNPTIGQLLSNFNPQGRDWVGEYYCYSCPTLYHQARFHFNYDGTWDFYDDEVYQSSGTVYLSAWPDYSTVPSFRVLPGGEEIFLWYPFGSFQYSNGPPDWPIIEYVAQ